MQQPDPTLFSFQKGLYSSQKLQLIINFFVAFPFWDAYVFVSETETHQSFSCCLDRTWEKPEDEIIEIVLKKKSATGWTNDKCSRFTVPLICTDKKQDRKVKYSPESSTCDVSRCLHKYVDQTVLNFFYLKVETMINNLMISPLLCWITGQHFGDILPMKKCSPSNAVTNIVLNIWPTSCRHTSAVWQISRRLTDEFFSLPEISISSLLFQDVIAGGRVKIKSKYLKMFLHKPENKPSMTGQRPLVQSH